MFGHAGEMTLRGLVLPVGGIKVRPTPPRGALRSPPRSFPSYFPPFLAVRFFILSTICSCFQEKLLAAHRGGIRHVCLPLRNAKDLEDLPSSVRQDLTFTLAGNITDVLAVAFEPPSLPASLPSSFPMEGGRPTPSSLPSPAAMTGTMPVAAREHDRNRAVDKEGNRAEEGDGLFPSQADLYHPFFSSGDPKDGAQSSYEEGMEAVQEEGREGRGNERLDLSGPVLRSLL